MRLFITVGIMGPQEFQILVSFVKPHKAVISSTVLRWLEDTRAV